MKERKGKKKEGREERSVGGGAGLRYQKARL